MMSAFPKIFAIGTDYIKEIFSGPVEITEKLDGSQFGFGKFNGELFIRSKGKQQFIDSPDKMFKNGVDYILSIEDRLPENVGFYCEYFDRPAHNVLKYERIPKNHLALFGVSSMNGSKFVSSYSELKEWADKLDIDVVPVLHEGEVYKFDEFIKVMESESCLGGTKIEGVVVKNYNQPFLLGGQPIPLMAGKFVSEKFKEVAKDKWGREFTPGGKWQVFKDSYKTEARWNKAIQHLKENGELENSLRDIGKLIIEVKKDIGQEEKEAIKNWLWKEFGDELLRNSVKGLPEFYKEKLASGSFNI